MSYLAQDLKKQTLFDSVYDIIEVISLTNSRLEKEEIIKKAKEFDVFVKCVEYAYNPFKKFNINQLKPRYNEFNRDLLNDKKDYVNKVFSFLDDLSKRNGVDNFTKAKFEKLISANQKTFSLISRIVNKDLRCGASIRTFKKAGIDIPEFGVMLCIGGSRKDITRDFRRFFNLANNDWSNIVWSKKLNGIRCFCYVEDPLEYNSFQYLSRNGKNYPNFVIFNKDIGKLALYIYERYSYKKIAFDGEITFNDDSKQENFDKLVSSSRTFTKQIPMSILNELKYNLFDIVIFDDLDIELKERLEILNNAIINHKSDKIDLVEHRVCNIDGINSFDSAINFVRKKSDWEGIVLKVATSPYEFKRSPYWLKIKNFETLDVNVVGFEYGTGKYEKLVGKLICEVNGKKFAVGSGLDDNERQLFLEELPNTIEIAFQSLSKDGIPIQPTFIRVRDDK